jgi:hypothetical protein
MVGFVQTLNHLRENKCEGNGGSTFIIRLGIAAAIVRQVASISCYSTYLAIHALRVGADAYTPDICKNKDPYKTCLSVRAVKTLNILVIIRSSD